MKASEHTMSMKKLGQLRPDIQIDKKLLLEHWKLRVMEISDWNDYQTGKYMGKKYEVAVIEDNYENEEIEYTKDLNLFEKFYIKVRGAKSAIVRVSVHDYVKPVNIKVLKPYGKWDDSLSCEAEAVVTEQDYQTIMQKHVPQGQQK